MFELLLPTVCIAIIVMAPFWNIGVWLEYRSWGSSPRFGIEARGRHLGVALSPKRGPAGVQAGFKNTLNGLPWRRCVVIDVELREKICYGVTFEGAAKRAVRRLGIEFSSELVRELSPQEASSSEWNRSMNP